MAVLPTRRPLSRRGRRYDDAQMGVGLLAGPANVIVQLVRPGVGYGVLESRVDSGRVDLHPIKRARTTFTYLAVAGSGSDEQKAAFREGVALGTMLHVPEEMWPADRAAFDEYWQESLAKVHIDDTVREYLYPIAAGRMRGAKLPASLQRRLDSINLLITTGFLPQRFRNEMRLDWNPQMQRRFDRLVTGIRTVNNLLPRFIQQFPFNVLLKDLDWRIRTGRPLV